MKRAQVEPGTTTVLAIGPAGGKQLDEVTGHLKTLPDCLQLSTLPRCDMVFYHQQLTPWTLHLNIEHGTIHGEAA